MARKLLVVLGLVAALTLGSLAVAPQWQVARAAADSLVVVWNEEALESVRKLPPGPTVTARALAVVHTAIYDAWAAYDPVAVDTRQRLRANLDLRQPEGERTQANKERAVSFAAYTALGSTCSRPASRRSTAAEWRRPSPAVTATDSSTPDGGVASAASSAWTSAHGEQRRPTSSTAIRTPASRRAISRSTPGTRS